MKILYLVSLVLFMTGIAIFFLMWYLENKKRIVLTPRKKAKFAILIPAKNESKVIENLLKSIEPQVDNFKDVYVIVEDSKDKTCSITKKYGGTIIVRKDLDGKRRKGYALDEALKKILKKEKYNLYFIIDADTTIDKNYITEMITSYKNGYDVILPYKNSISCDNTIKTCSALTFSFVNNIINKKKAKLNHSLLVSGSGIAISDKLINIWQGYPFTSLTEDYELSLYCTSNNVPMIYNENAICYIEHPDNMKDSIKQRTRWIKGFFEARAIRLNDIKDDYTKAVGIVPYILLIIGILTFLLANIIDSIYYFTSSNYMYYYTISSLVTTLFLVYLTLVIFTIILFRYEKKEFNVDKKNKIKAIFFNPIFLVTYIICLIKSLRKKNLGWEVIEHKKEKIES